MCKSGALKLCAAYRDRTICADKGKSFCRTCKTSAGFDAPIIKTTGRNSFVHRRVHPDGKTVSYIKRLRLKKEIAISDLIERYHAVEASVKRLMAADVQEFVVAVHSVNLWDIAGNYEIALHMEDAGDVYTTKAAPAVSSKAIAEAADKFAASRLLHTDVWTAFAGINRGNIAFVVTEETESIEARFIDVDDVGAFKRARKDTDFLGKFWRAVFASCFQQHMAMYPLPSYIELENVLSICESLNMLISNQGVVDNQEAQDEEQ